MAPEPNPQMLALDYYADLGEHLVIAMGDKRDAAKILRRQAAELTAQAEVKDEAADAIRARLNRLSLVRARILDGTS